MKIKLREYVQIKMDGITENSIQLPLGYPDAILLQAETKSNFNVRIIEEGAEKINCDFAMLLEMQSLMLSMQGKCLLFPSFLILDYDKNCHHVRLDVKNIDPLNDSGKIKLFIATGNL